MSEVTRILSQLEAGHSAAASELLPLVYEELRNLAAAKLAQEKPGQTLQATALVHEAYLRLVGPANRAGFENRGHFFAAAAEAMRRLLVENARRKQRQRHGGQHQRVELADDDLACAVPDEVLLELDEALSQLAKEDPVKAKLVELRYFVGLTEDEAAAVLKISRATAKRHWRYARAWLHRQVADDEATDPIPENL